MGGMDGPRGEKRRKRESVLFLFSFSPLNKGISGGVGGQVISWRGIDGWEMRYYMISSSVNQSNAYIVSNINSTVI